MIEHMFLVQYFACTCHHNSLCAPFRLHGGNSAMYSFGLHRTHLNTSTLQHFNTSTLQHHPHHSATLPSPCRQTGFRQLCPTAAIFLTCSSLISMPSPGPSGMLTYP